MNKYLKLFYGMLMSLMVFSMAACGDDDDEPAQDNKPSTPTTESAIVGTWVDEDCEPGHPSYMQFTKDGKINLVLIERDGLVVSHAKWTLENNVINVSNFVYDRKLTTAPDPYGDFKDGDWVEKFIIETLSSDKMITRIVKDGYMSSRFTVYNRVSDSLIEQYLK